jgi:lysophospholipase L1-like esterase
VTVDGLPATITAASSTSITATAPLRTAATGFGTLAASRIRLTTAGRTQAVGNIARVFRLLAIGDSFTEGQLVERTLKPVPPPDPNNPTPPPEYEQKYSFAAPPYPEALESLLRADPRYGTNADVDNEGYAGECASINGCSGNPSSGLGRIGGLVAAKKFDAVIILEGFNDLNAGGNLSTTVSALRTMGRTAQASGATVLMGRIHVMRRDMWDAIATMAAQEKFLRVDFGTSVEIGNDNVHPTQKGYDTMAGIAFSAVKSVFK